MLSRLEEADNLSRIGNLLKEKSAWAVETSSQRSHQIEGDHLPKVEQDKGSCNGGAGAEQGAKAEHHFLYRLVQKPRRQCWRAMVCLKNWGALRSVAETNGRTAATARGSSSSQELFWRELQVAVPHRHEELESGRSKLNSRQHTLLVFSKNVEPPFEWTLVWKCNLVHF